MSDDAKLAVQTRLGGVSCSQCNGYGYEETGGGLETCDACGGAGEKIKLTVVPMVLAEALAFVDQYHRHSAPPEGHKFSIGISDGRAVRGVAMVGRPVARHLQDGWTLEVNRCCTDGVKNGCSMLYAAAWRATRALGWKRLVTYTLTSEPGTSLRAAGWEIVGEVRGNRSWSCRSRPRVDTDPNQPKLRWEPSTTKKRIDEEVGNE